MRQIKRDPDAEVLFDPELQARLSVDSNVNPLRLYFEFMLSEFK